MASPAPIPQGLPLDLLGSSVKEEDSDKIWDGKISVTASTEGFWGIDSEFQLKSRIDQLKRKFHENRFLKVKFLPTDVTEQKIQQMLSDFPVARIQLHNKTNSAGAATVLLEDPELFEEWDANRTFMLRGQRIPVFPSHTQSWVCVAGLPRQFPESSFYDLVKTAGDVRNYIYMISEKTGENKGYGMADFSTREKAHAACDKLKGLKIGDLPFPRYSKKEEMDFPLWVEMLHPKCLTFDSLHSKCLHISNLPPQYKDMAHLRKLFSVVAQPPYCQIAMKNGCSLGWGLVEYNSSEDAEMTLTMLNGKKIGDRTPRIAYYVPGVRAIHLYSQLCAKDTSKPTSSSSGNGLLPDPIAPDICNVVRKLKAQNPVFALNLGHILYTERMGNKASQSSGSESDEQGSTKSKRPRSYKEACSRTPSPLSDLLPLPRFSTSPNLLPTPEDSAGEHSPTENRVPMMSFPPPGPGFINQASLHQMMAAAQNFGNDPNQVVPGGYPFRSPIPMLPVGFLPFGPVATPGLYPMSLPVVPQSMEMPIEASQANPRLPTPENMHNSAINFTNQLETLLGRKTPSVPPGFENFPTSNKLESGNFVVTTPVTPPGYDKFTPPKKMEASSPETPPSDSKFPSPSKVTEEALNMTGICNLWGPKDLSTPVYNRLCPNGLLEKVPNLNGGIWATNTSPPSLKRRSNVWPIYVESDFLSVTQSKRPRND